MRRYTVLWIAAALLLTTASASADEVSDYDRFRLWNECRPMDLLVEKLPDDAAAIGLTMEAIEVAVRSRLRSGRLYSDDAWAYLYVNMNVQSSGFAITVNYYKSVMDIATTLERRAATWDRGAAGTHGQDPNFILSNVVQHADAFIDGYLRVNADACK